MQFSDRSRFLGEINVVPLVDVVLVLLIIFMVTTPLMVRGLDVDLPASASNTIEPEERLLLTVDKNQRIFLDQKRVRLDDLEEVLRQRVRTIPSPTIYLEADQKVPYGVVIRIMDIIKKAGIDRLGMITQPPRRI